MDLLVEDVDELDVMHDESEAMIGRVRDRLAVWRFVSQRSARHRVRIPAAETENYQIYRYRYPRTEEVVLSSMK